MKPLFPGLCCLVWLCAITGCSSLGSRPACGSIEDPARDLLRQGYYPVLSRCEFVYCRNGPATGSQLVVRQCFTGAALRQREKDAKELLRRLEENPVMEPPQNAKRSSDAGGTR